jgi:hypothetical protein
MTSACFRKLFTVVDGLGQSSTRGGRRFLLRGTCQWKLDGSSCSEDRGAVMGSTKRRTRKGTLRVELTEDKGECGVVRPWAAGWKQWPRFETGGALWRR